jgi:tight adherence protein C
VNVLTVSTDAAAAGAFAGAASFLARAVRAGAADPASRAEAILALQVATRSARGGHKLLGAVGRTAPGRRVQRRLTGKPEVIRRLELAGAARSLHELAGRMVVGAGCGALLCLAVALMVPPALALAPLGALVGARFPIIRVARAAKRRQARIQAQVPELVELLVAGTEAGLPPATAFARSADLVPGPLGDEVRTSAAQIDLGLPWRAALDELVSRTDAPALGSMARALARAHRLGGSVHGSLRTIVGELRSERRARAEELARRAPVKMLFPLVFLILPAFLLLTVGPVLLATVRSLH